jgi:MFS family permease
MQALRPTGRTIYFFGALGGLLFGYDTGVISGALLFIPNAFKLTPFVKGAVVAGLLLGAMIGAAFAGRMSDRMGRRRLIIIAAIVFTGGALLAAFAPTVTVLIVARFIIGLAVGSAALVVPLYLAEIAPTQIRGRIASLNQLMIVCGILAAFIVNAILASSQNWRLMLGLAAAPSLVLLVGMLFMPETPRYLVHGPVFLGYAGLGVLAALFVKMFVAETKGRSLEQIEADLQRAAGRRGGRQAEPQQAALSQ